MGGAILDAGRMEGGGALDCDVVVVGSGSGGGAAAAYLAEAGLDVVVLEEGGHYTSADFTRGVAESLARLYRDGGSSVIFGKPNILFQEGRCVGGSTVINGGMAWRTPEPVMERWRREHGLEFMTPAGMEPWFRAVDESIHAAPQHPDSISPGDRLFRDSAESLGIPVVPNRRSQVECRGSNVCILGCPDNRKQAVHVTYIPRAVAAGARVVTRCRATRVLTRGGRAVGVAARAVGGGGGGRPLEVHARRVYLAGGALQTPALLRRSGLAGGSGRLGRNLLCHPNIKVLGIYDRDVYYWKGVHQGFQIHHFMDDGILLACGGVPPAVIAFALQQVGEENLRLMEQYNRMLLTAALIEDSTSGRVRALPGGMVWASYSIDDLERRRIRRAAALLSEIHFNAGATRVLLPFRHLPEIRSMDEVERIRTVPLGAHDVELHTVHAMGTCAMGGDPRRHVVRPTGECWEVGDLYVGDASVLPTGTGINPQVTIQALALRIAGGIADQLRR